jgi:hypothetical protein
MESVVFLLFSSSIISMLGGTIQEPSIQKLYLGFLLTDPTKKPQHQHWFLQNLSFCSRVLRKFQFYKCYENAMK